MYNKWGSKYNNRICYRDGIRFDSALELEVYQIIKEDVLEVHPKLYLTEARILYKPDFKCKSKGFGHYFVEVKGFETATWKLKKRLWRAYGKDELHLYVKEKGRIYLKEIIRPKAIGGEVVHGTDDDTE